MPGTIHACCIGAFIKLEHSLRQTYKLPVQPYNKSEEISQQIERAQLRDQEVREEGGNADMSRLSESNTNLFLYDRKHSIEELDFVDHTFFYSLISATCKLISSVLTTVA